MADFETHVRVGTAVHITLIATSLCLLASGVETLVVVATTIGLPVTVTGAVFPDIDHHASRPYQLAERWLPVLVAGLAGVVIGAQLDRLYSLIGLVTVGDHRLFVAGVAYTCFVWSVLIGTRRLIPICRPRHRTVTHRVVTGLGVACLIAGVGVTVTAAIGLERTDIVGVTWALCFLSGFLSHLYYDDLFPSVRVGLG